MRDLRRPYHSGFHLTLGLRILDRNLGVFRDRLPKNEHGPAGAHCVRMAFQRLRLAKHVN